MNQSKLPKFEAGGSIARELGANRMNALVNAIKMNAPLAGPGVKVAPSKNGTMISLSRNQYLAGAYTNPYVAGSLGDGCAGSPVNGVYGGSTDTPETNPENPHTDTWDREKQLDSITNVRTVGYTGPFIRVESYTETPDPADSVRIGVWIRTPIFDSRGCLVSVGPEVQELALLVATPPP